MRGIFISYRRDDSEGQAGRIFADLARQFGDDSVFMDVADIEPGVDFRQVIDKSVASCGVLLVVIGKNWLGAKNDAGQRRLDNPLDFVRLETAAALKRDIPVVPVLVQGASNPRVEELPEDLRELAFRNSIQLSHVHWESDMQVLVKALRRQLNAPPEPSTAVVTKSGPASPNRRKVPRAVIAALGVAALALAIAGYFWLRESPGTESTAGNLPLVSPTPAIYATPIPQSTSTVPVASPTPAETPSPAATPTPAETPAVVTEAWLYVGHKRKNGWVADPYLDVGDNLPIQGESYTTTADGRNLHAPSPRPFGTRLPPVLKRKEEGRWVPVTIPEGQRVTVIEVAPSVGRSKVWVRVRTVLPGQTPP